jgi:RecA/RadA recombinase
MRIEKSEGSRGKKILTAMIVDPVVLGRIAPRWDGELFSSTWENLVGAWCVDYYRKYEAAPGRAIEGLFESWADDQADESTVGLVERFLNHLSDEYSRKRKERNSDYILDLAQGYFETVRLRKLAESIEGDLTMGKLDRARKRVQKSVPVEMNGESLRSVFDMKTLKKAFLSKSEPLITYPGALGVFLGSTLERDGFVSIEGPEKRGKTFFLMEFAWQALKQGRNVLFFEIGDLSEDQIMRRFAARFARHPIELPRNDGVVEFPKFVERRGESVEVSSKRKKFTEPLSIEKTIKIAKEMRAKYGNRLKVSVHPNNSVGVGTISTLVESEAREGRVPDVIVIDYADLLLPPPGYGNTESRDAINANWKSMRAISQQYHCLLLTGTQAKAESYDADILTMKSFSDDKRKRSHVTATIGLNQTDPEKEMGVTRLNWIVRRESDFSQSEVVFVAGCLAIASPCMVSCF